MKLFTFLLPSSSSCFRLFIVLTLYHCCLSHENFNKAFCIKRERVALLQFKYDLIDHANRLSSWNNEEEDCCNWRGIVCNNVTGHVQEIHLGGPVFDDIFSEPKLTGAEQEYSYTEYEEVERQRLGGRINPSLLNLEQLEYLDLSRNDFEYTQIPSFIGSLQNLRYLNISYSLFSGEIPHQLGNLSRLHVLSVSGLPLRVENLQWLSGLSMLHHLNMINVNLGKVFDWAQVMNTLPSLVELHLSGCNLTHIPLYFPTVNFSSLAVLDLSLNSFDSVLPRWIFSIGSLVSVDLWRCYFHGPAHSPDFGNLTSLRNLRIPENHFMNSSESMKGLSVLGSTLVSLDISANGIFSSILGDLQNMTSLVSLDLSGNWLNQTIPKSLGNLCDLKEIDLSSTGSGKMSLSEILKSFFLCKSPKLESLTVSYSDVTGHLPNQLEQLDKLVNLRLQRNSLSGQIPFFLGSLSSLEYLDLSSNSFSGLIPVSIGGLSSLKQLDLSNNRLNGSLPESIGQLLNLEYFGIEYNLLTGIVNEKHFANLTRLKQFSANGNRLTLKPNLVEWVPPFQLRNLHLSSWNLGSQFPLWFQLQRDLVKLDLGNTGISWPNRFWNVFSHLSFVNLSHNQLHGSFRSIPPWLKVIDLSSNRLSGPIPELLNGSFPVFIDLSNNSFSGSLKRLMCPRMQYINVHYPFFLNLANNNLSGVIPICLVKSNTLASLNLENNNLRGGIPNSFAYLSYLKSLNVRNNKLSGKLPSELFNLTRLTMLQLAGNELTGTIPKSIPGGFTSLKLLNLRSNKFVGEIPYELCRLNSIQILDLAHNNLSGNIPSCFNNFSVMSGQEDSSGNTISRSFVNEVEVKGSATLMRKGREDTYSSILGLLKILDLSSNNLSGHIPSELMTLVRLQSLNISGNRLQGRMPEKIGYMKSLETLDLSMNQLDGEIPSSLSNLNFLSSLNLSFNNLTGRIPTSTQLQSLDNSSFIGNNLCGPPLTKDCGVVVPDDDADGGSNRSHGVEWGLIISILLGFLAGFWLVVAPLIVSRLWRIVFYGFVDKVRYKIYDFISKYLWKVHL